MDVTLEDAFREGCTALGEAIVEKRLLMAELREAQAALAAQADSPTVADPTD